MISAMMLSSAVYARDLGVVGKLYPIQERDALEELESRAAKVDWKKKLGKIKPEKYRPENSVSLPRASKSSVRLVDVTYVLDIDVPDGKGGIVYPKGYSFNPLDYVPFRRTIVVINAQDHEQVAWFKSSEYAKRIDVMLLITEGGYLEVSKSLNRPIFYADTRIAEKFQIHSVPAIVRQSGRMMEVTDVYIPKTAKSRGL
jgi:conjugal transfer pilus assembly protein TraW